MLAAPAKSSIPNNDEIKKVTPCVIVMPFKRKGITINNMNNGIGKAKPDHAENFRHPLSVCS